MLKLFKTLFLLCLVSSLNAQKVKLKNFKVKAAHVNLPTIGFAPDVTTYDCTAEGNETVLSRYGITLSEISSRIKINGYTKVEGGGSVSIVVDMGAPTASSRETVTEDKVTKDKKKYKLYSYFFNLSSTGTYKVLNANGAVLSEGVIEKKEKLSTSEYRSLAQLQKYYRENYPQKKTSALKNLFYANIADINQRLNRAYSVGKVISTVSFEHLKSKSHPDLEAFKEIRTVVESAFEKMTAKDNTAFVEAIQPAIDFWVKQEPTYSTKDKQTKKLKFACRYNAALAYFWAEDFDNALKYASMIEDGEVSSKKGKRLKEQFNKVKDRMAALDLSSRHFEVKMSEEAEAKIAAFNEEQEAIYGSGDISKFPEFNKKMGVKLESNVEAGKLFYKDGKVDEGFFVYESIDGFTPDFTAPRSIRFGKDDNGQILKGNPKYSGLDSILIGAKTYHVRNVTLGSGLAALKLKNAIVEDIKNYDRTILQIIHPPFKRAKILGNETELESSYSIHNKEKKKDFSPDGLSFTKSMKKAIGDCSQAMAYVNEMKAKKKKKKLLDKLASSAYETEDLHQILSLYDECN